MKLKFYKVCFGFKTAMPEKYKLYYLLSKDLVDVDLQVDLGMCWDPYVSPGCTIRLVFFCNFSALFQHVNLVTTS